MRLLGRYKGSPTPDGQKGRDPHFMLQHPESCFSALRMRREGQDTAAGASQQTAFSTLSANMLTLPLYLGYYVPLPLVPLHHRGLRPLPIGFPTIPGTASLPIGFPSRPWRAGRARTARTHTPPYAAEHAILHRPPRRSRFPARAAPEGRRRRRLPPPWGGLGGGMDLPGRVDRAERGIPRAPACLASAGGGPSGGRAGCCEAAKRPARFLSPPLRCPKAGTTGDGAYGKHKAARLHQRWPRSITRCLPRAGGPAGGEALPNDSELASRCWRSGPPGPDAKGLGWRTMLTGRHGAGWGWGWVVVVRRGWGNGHHAIMWGWLGLGGLFGTWSVPWGWVGLGVFCGWASPISWGWDTWGWVCSHH